MAPQKNGISKIWLLVFSSTTKTLLIKPTPTIRRKLEKLDFKIPWPWVEKSFSKITQLSPWHVTFGHSFGRCTIFVRDHILWVSYLSILGGVFVKCHFCKVPLFSNGIKGCFFCWVPFLLGISDGAVFVFFIASYVHREYSLGLSNCNYLLFYQ